jgi:membrane fusion protein (multidrug efflux system)
VPRLPWSKRPAPPAPIGSDGTALAEPRARSAAASPARRRRWLRRALLLLGPALVLIVGGYFYITGGRYVDTDDAYVRADMVAVTARVSGPIVEIDVRENQHVDPGQVLFRLDEEPFKIALAQAQARLNKAENDVRALQASYRQKQQELELAHRDVDFAEHEFQRQAKLAKRDFASQAKYDETQHNLQVAHQRVAMAEQDLRGLLADLAGDPDMPVERHPTYLEAKAARDQAALDLQHAVVYASFAGVASRKPDLGDYVTAGSPVMSIVADQDVWVEANFKETDLTHVRPGQAASVEVDTYPDRDWPAIVESISQATGAQFSVLPPQNATGNWVKVVQRIPVRIALHTRPGDPPLRAGMSVTAEIDTGHQRELPGFVQTALAWAGYVAEPGSAQARSR